MPQSIPCLVTALLVLVCRHALAEPPRAGAVARIDHIQVEHGDGPFELWSHELGLPVVWPMRSYGTFSSGGVYFGNVVTEFGRFRTDAPDDPAADGAHVAGIALQPTVSAAGSAAELDLRQILHGPASAYAPDNDTGAGPLWTTVPIRGVALQGSGAFICEYHFDTRPGITAARAAIVASHGGSLGLIECRRTGRTRA